MTKHETNPPTDAPSPVRSGLFGASRFRISCLFRALRSGLRASAAGAALAFCAAAAPAAAAAVSDLDGAVMCGYQGWFRTPGDGSNEGWVHYASRGGFKPGSCSIDLWPDVAELDADERIPTEFRHADGSVAHVFSSHNRKTVDRHFRWMKEYGIDGAFIQRFASATGSKRIGSLNTVLDHCRAGAVAHGRKWAVMYDLSGLAKGRIDRVIDDWTALIRERNITTAPGCMRHRGRPLVAAWGAGFNDDKNRPSLDDWRKLVAFLKSDAGGGCAVMLGVPFGWRTLNRDSLPDPGWHALIRSADVVSPWSVGRYRDPAQVAKTVQRHWADDLAWCREAGLTYLPVAFPGFSWQNLKKGRGETAALDQVPRRGGAFLWSQAVAAQRAGARGLYIAMFDELDEGTAIFKCSGNPPVGASAFVKVGDVPADHYLRLAGQAGLLLRGALPATDALPARR